ncbi:MAG TPA: hypothetical protein VGU02_00485, partial [Gaiellaceae bacterium]|nr:hypothetical protein [Gaiellaceae bacterium]
QMLVMAAAAIPVYLLARTLVPRRWAQAAALGTLCTSAYVFGPLILPEALAYTWFAMTAYISVQALAGKGRRWKIAAIVACLLGLGVRNQLAMTIAALGLAAAILWVVGPRGRHFRRTWTVADHVGAAVVLIGVFIVLNRYAGPHVQLWATVTQSWKGRLFSFGFQSGAALAIGLGILPAIGGLASLWVPERKHDPQWRAFAAFLGASVLAYSTYTATKAAYNSTIIFSRIEERNMIYLQPLLLIGTAVVLSARRVWWPGVVVAGAFIAGIVLGYGYQLAFPYTESPGYGIATMANRFFYWNQGQIKLAFAVVVVLSLAILLLHRHPRLPETPRGIALAAVCVALAVWMATGQVTEARGVQSAGHSSVVGLQRIGATPLDWVDQLTKRAGTSYLGQNLNLSQPLGLWLTEFWNPSIEHAYTLDSTYPGPGPSTTPGLARPNGELTGDPGLPYVLADNGVQMIGTPIVQHGSLILYRIHKHPWRLQESAAGISPDGWTVGEAPNKFADGSFAYFGPQTTKGTLTVQAWSTLCPPSAPRQFATIEVGTVALTNQQKPVVRRVEAKRHIRLANCSDKNRVSTLTFHVAPPVAVTVHVAPTLRPSDYGQGDVRELGAHLGFGFKAG